QFGPNSFLPNPRIENIYNFVDNVSLVRGNHQIKFGVDYLRISGEGRVPIEEHGDASFTPIDFSELGGTPGLPFFTAVQAFDPASRTPAQRGFLQLLAVVLPGISPGFPKGVPLIDLPLPFGYDQGFAAPGNVPASGNFFSLFAQDDYKLRPNLII